MYRIKDDKRSIESATRLYNALCQLMAEKAFEQITVTELTGAAQVARATFYRNFDHIEDILHYEIDLKFKGLKTFLNRYYASKPDYVMQFFIVPFLTYWEEDSRIIELLIVSDKIHILKDAFVTLLRSGIEAYYSEGGVDIDHYNYFLAMRSGIAVNILVQWVNNGKRESPTEIIDILFKQIDGTMNYKMFAKDAIC